MGREIKQERLTLWSAIANGASGIALPVGGALVFVHFWRGVACLVGGLLSAVISPVLIASVTVKSEAEIAKTEERKKALATFVGFIHRMIDVDKRHDLRVTLLDVDRGSDPLRLRQVARCTCKGSMKPGETSMYVSQGVAGRCYQTVKNVNVSFPDGDFVERMLEFGFSEKEARQFQPRRSYLCSPIVDGNKDVIGVLALDAIDPNVFTPIHVEATEWITPFFAGFLTEPEVGEGYYG